MSRTTVRRIRWAAVPLVALALAGTTASCSGDAEPDGGSGLPIAGRLTADGTAPGGTLPADAPPVATETSTTAATTTTAPPSSPPAPGPAPPAASARPAGGGTAGCPNVEIVTARGTGEAQAAAMGLAGLNQGIAAQVPNVPIYQVVYPASADFLNSANVGTQDALAHMRAKAGQCPNTRFFLTGYSQGAMVMTGTLQKIGDLGPRVIGGVFYGNPYYKGTSPTAAGPDMAATGIIPGGIPPAWGGKVHDYCVVGDTVCGSGANGAVGLTRGISREHLTYPTSPLQGEAIGWAVGLIRNA
jgi:cutinase